eukprot:364779-Chlamydomonas_euryale.AAC.12
MALLHQAHRQDDCTAGQPVSAIAGHHARAQIGCAWQTVLVPSCLCCSALHSSPNTEHQRMLSHVPAQPRSPGTAVPVFHATTARFQ